jgi:hypothetical protein
MTEHAHMALCAGRIGLADEDRNCARRDHCARYQRLLALAAEGVPADVQVYTLMCRDGRDALVPIGVQP